MRIKNKDCFFILNNMEGTTNINQLPSDNVYDSNIVIETKPIDNNDSTGFRPVQNNMPQAQQTQQMQPQPQMQPQMQSQMQPQMQPQIQPQMQPQMQQGQMYSDSRSTTPFPQQQSLNQQTNNDPSLIQHLNSVQTSNLINNGTMDLPSRDIPMSQNHITQDPNIQPNHIPSGNSNFINNQISQDMVNDFSRKQNNIQHNNDFIYEESKIPVIIAILYYIFYQQFVDNNIKILFPSLFNNEQRLKKSGILLKSLLFGLTYFALDKLITHFSKI